MDEKPGLRGLQPGLRASGQAQSLVPQSVLMGFQPCLRGLHPPAMPYGPLARSQRPLASLRPGFRSL